MKKYISEIIFSINLPKSKTYSLFILKNNKYEIMITNIQNGEIYDGFIHLNNKITNGIHLIEIFNEYFQLHDSYYVDIINLPSKQQKYCRCVIGVSKNTNTSIYNPYAICTTSIGKQSYNCGIGLDYFKLDITYIKTYAKMKKINTKNKTKSQLIYEILEKELESK